MTRLTIFWHCFHTALSKRDYFRHPLNLQISLKAGLWKCQNSSRTQSIKNGRIQIILSRNNGLRDRYQCLREFGARRSFSTELNILISIPNDHTNSCLKRILYSLIPDIVTICSGWLRVTSISHRNTNKKCKKLKGMTRNSEPKISDTLKNTNTL